MTNILLTLLLFLSFNLIGQEALTKSKIPIHINGKKILKNYFQSIGGEKELLEVETLVKKFTIKIDGTANINMTGKVLYKTPNLYYSELQVEKIGEFQSTKYNGNTCTVTRQQNNNQIETEIEGELLEEKMKDFYPFPLLILKNNTSFTALEKHTTEKNTLYKVYVDDFNDKDSLFLFFDTQTNYLIKRQEINSRTRKTTEYKDYRKINNIMFPFMEISTIEMNGDTVQKSYNQITEIIINQPIENSSFE